MYCRFLLRVSLITCGLLSTVDAADKLNLVAIVTDDQATWTLGSYGGADAVTPHLDRLARDGARFTHAFAATPVCSPSPADYETCERWQLWLDYGDEPYGAQCIEFQLSHPPRLIPTPHFLLSPMVFRVPASPAYARRPVVWARRSQVDCPAEILDITSDADDGNDDSPLARWL